MSKDSKCTHVLLDRTLSLLTRLIIPDLTLPLESIFSLLLFCVSLSQSLSSIPLFQFPGFTSKGAFCCCAVFRQFTVECKRRQRLSLDRVNPFTCFTRCWTRNEFYITPRYTRDLCHKYLYIWSLSWKQRWTMKQ